MGTNVNLTRGEKILLALLQLSGKSRKSIRFEDIVVTVFKSFPQDFQLKGYPEYPDSGDMVHKPLYDFKKKGLVQAGNKMFALTEKGLVAAERLRDVVKGADIKSTVRLGRDVEKEIARITKTPGFAFFAKDEQDKLVDTDFFDFIGATVRTPRNDFIGRLNTVKDVVAEVSDKSEPRYVKLTQYNDFMRKQFASIIEYKTEH